ncbi:MAG: MOSC domain-containing protein, partial [Pseudomonadota bacterium]
MQAEHLPVIAALAGHAQIAPATLRRNLVISGLNLANWRDKCLTIGDVTLRLTIPCAPCSRMEEALGHGGYAAMRGHGGWCAEVLAPGTIAIGDTVTPSMG